MWFEFTKTKICGKKNAKCSKCTKVNVAQLPCIALFSKKPITNTPFWCLYLLLWPKCGTSNVHFDGFFSSTWECLQPFTLLFTAHWTSGRGEIWRRPNHIFLQEIFWWEARNSWTFKFSTCRKTNGLQSWRSLGNQFKRVSQIVPSHFGKRTAIATYFDGGR